MDEDNLNSASESLSNFASGRPTITIEVHPRDTKKEIVTRKNARGQIKGIYESRSNDQPLVDSFNRPKVGAVSLLNNSRSM